MGRIGCVRFEKFRCDFAARTFALIALVQPVLYRAPCSNETIQNAFKHYEMHQNMCLGPNGVDQVHSLQKILMRLRGTNFCTNFTSSTRFATSFVQYWNNPKCTQTLWNAPNHEFRVQWGGSGAFVAKNSDATLWHKLVHWLHLLNPFCTKFRVIMKHWQKHPNTTKRTKTWV